MARNIESRLAWLESAAKDHGCPVCSRQLPVMELVGEDEIVSNAPRLPAVCPACGKTLPIRRVIVQERIVGPSANTAENMQLGTAGGN